MVLVLRFLGISIPLLVFVYIFIRAKQGMRRSSFPPFSNGWARILLAELYRPPFPSTPKFGQADEPWQ